MIHNKQKIPTGFEDLTESFQKSYSVNIDDIIIDQKTNILIVRGLFGNLLRGNLLSFLKDLKSRGINARYANIRHSETVTVNLLCPDDNETYVETEIDLEEVNIMLDEDHNTECTLGKDAKGNDCSITMNYPSVESTLKANEETSSVERIF